MRGIRKGDEHIIDDKRGERVQHAPRKIRRVAVKADRPCRVALLRLEGTEADVRGGDDRNAKIGIETKYYDIF